MTSLSTIFLVAAVLYIFPSCDHRCVCIAQHEEFGSDVLLRYDERKSNIQRQALVAQMKKKPKRRSSTPTGSPTLQSDDDGDDDVVGSDDVSTPDGASNDDKSQETEVPSPIPTLKPVRNSSKRSKKTSPPSRLPTDAPNTDDLPTGSYGDEPGDDDSSASTSPTGQPSLLQMIATRYPTPSSPAPTPFKLNPTYLARKKSPSSPALKAIPTYSPSTATPSAPSTSTPSAIAGIGTPTENTYYYYTSTPSSVQDSYANYSYGNDTFTSDYYSISLVQYGRCQQTLQSTLAHLPLVQLTLRNQAPPSQ